MKNEGWLVNMNDKCPICNGDLLLNEIIDRTTDKRIIKDEYFEYSDCGYVTRISSPEAGRGIFP